jgi:hypothetical protein
MTKLIATFRRFGNGPKNVRLLVNTVAGLKNDTTNDMGDQLRLRSKILKPQSTAADDGKYEEFTAQVASFIRGYH